eukprot:scaffold221542_cov22-Tisochrysis_lutea.AAC.1
MSPKMKSVDAMHIAYADCTYCYSSVCILYWHLRTSFSGKGCCFLVAWCGLQAAHSWTVKAGLRIQRMV